MIAVSTGMCTMRITTIFFCLLVVVVVGFFFFFFFFLGGGGAPSLPLMLSAVSNIHVSI